jgi:hypothetical protein
MGSFDFTRVDYAGMIDGYQSGAIYGAVGRGQLRV